jgi:hypothetical protein
VLVAILTEVFFVAEPASLAVVLGSRGVSLLEVALMTARTVLVALVTEIGCPTMTLTAVLLVALLAVDLKPVLLEMVLGHLLARVALHALATRALTIMTAVHTHSHRGTVDAKLILVVDQFQVARHTIDLKDLDMGAMRDQQVPVGRYLPGERVALQASLGRGRTEQIPLLRALE